MTRGGITVKTPFYAAREQSTVETQVRRFYDTYWPSNLPSREDLQETHGHLQKIIPDKRYARALDAGCGLGVCSVALSTMSERVVGVDHSLGSLRAAVKLAAEVNSQNVAFIEGSLMDIPCDDETFDVILCWGVLMYVPSVERVFGELVRTLRPGGTLVVAVHRKTLLTPLHDGIRRLCLRIPESAKGPAIKAAALPIRVASAALGKRAARDDLSLEAKIDDFYFIPFKRFFSLAEVEGLFGSYGLSSEVIYAYTGRFKSSSSVIVRGMKPGKPFSGW
jgi:2-polyprenyl-6-hydroxyphenyl methylase / 3-demethylubiquinone-9 3-methyltransferase